MKLATQNFLDQLAIGGSALCAIHCLALPLLAVLLPSMAALPLQEESFHIWMVIAVVPISAYALTMGCKRHEDYRVLFIGSLGLLILAFTAFFGHDFFGEQLEKIFTVIGATIIASMHVWNYRLCQRQDMCVCNESQS